MLSLSGTRLVVWRSGERSVPEDVVPAIQRTVGCRYDLEAPAFGKDVGLRAEAFDHCPQGRGTGCGGTAEQLRHVGVEPPCAVMVWSEGDHEIAVVLHPFRLTVVQQRDKVGLESPWVAGSQDLGQHLHG